MARPFKPGLDYFSLDTDIFANHKVRSLIMAQGAKALTVFICILCNIYRDKGYYLEWDEERLALTANELGLNERAVQAVVQKATEVRLFDANMLEKYGVLTSHEVQERYFEIMRACKRKSIRYDARFLLLNRQDLVNSGINAVIYGINGVNSVNNTQRKEKESKVSTTTGEEVDIGRVVKIYQENIHPVASPIEADKLAELIHSFGADSCIKAIERAVIRGNRSLSYITGILNSWQKRGYDEEGDKSGQQNKAERSATGRTGSQRLRTGNQPPKEGSIRKDWSNSPDGWDF